MFPAPFRVILDANVLYPFTLRDTLLRAASAAYYQVYWSSEILDEATRNLVANGVMTEAQATRLRGVLERVFPDAAVEGYEPLVAAMRNDPKDRHVAAAAVKAHAQVIVTANLKDFADLPDGVEAQSPDAFLCNLFDLDARGFVELLREQADDLTRPPVTFDELLDRIARIAPDFAALVREHVQLG